MDEAPGFAPPPRGGFALVVEVQCGYSVPSAALAGALKEQDTPSADPAERAESGGVVAEFFESRLESSFDRVPLVGGQPISPALRPALVDEANVGSGA